MRQQSVVLARYSLIRPKTYPRLRRCRKACCLCAFEAADSHAQSLSGHLYLLACASQRTFSMSRVLSSTLALTCWHTPGLLPHCALHNTRRLARLCVCATGSVCHKFRASTAPCLLVQHRQLCPPATLLRHGQSSDQNIDAPFAPSLDTDSSSCPMIISNTPP